MDKYEIVFDIIGHPEKYSADRLAELFADKEIADIYNLVCNTHAAVKSHSVSIDVDDEWSRFSRRNGLRGGSRRRPAIGRVASIALLFLSSLVALAVGFAVKTSFVNEKPGGTSPDEADDEIENLLSVTVTDDTTGVDARRTLQPVLFEDETLGNIMQAIGDHYGLKVNFRNEAAADLRLYYKFDPTHTVEEIVESLNTFDGINILIDDNILWVD